MKPAFLQQVRELMMTHSICTLATVREDGYPQATTVAYVNDGIDLYVCCDIHAQKLYNIRRCGKVSVTIDRECVDWHRIRGLSLGGDAEEVKEPQQIRRAFDLMYSKFSELSRMGPAEALDTEAAVIRIHPKVISLIDYRQGLGHTEYLVL